MRHDATEARCATAVEPSRIKHATLWRQPDRPRSQSCQRRELRLLFAAELVARLLDVPLLLAFFAEELVARLLLAPDGLDLAYATGAIRASDAMATINW